MQRKRIELLLSAVLIPVDYLMVVAAGALAYALRFGSTVTDIRPVFYELSFAHFFPLLLLAAGAFVIIFAVSGLYTIRSTKRFREEVTSVFLGVSTSITAIIILFFFQRELFSSRFIILTGWIFALVLVTLGRFVIRTIQQSLLRRGIGTYRVVVIGNDGTTLRLLEEIRERPGRGFVIAAHVPELTAAARDRLEQLAAQRHIDILLQGEPDLPREHTRILVDLAVDYHLAFRYAADVLEMHGAQITVESFAGIPIVELERTKLEGWGRITKRTLDLILAGLAFLVLSPILLMLAIIVKADSRGPALVRLERVGQHGRTFFVYKFRSMVVNAHALKEQLLAQNERNDGPLFKMKNDPRITRVGRVLRRTSLDELPQLLNVLKGEMSLVGPRPHEPNEVAQYERYQRLLLTIKPGMTGLAQISGRSELSFRDEVRLDLFYIQHWTFGRDLAILFKTPLVVLRMKSVA